MSISTIAHQRMMEAMKAKDKKTKDIYAYLLDNIQKEQKSRQSASNPNPVLTEADEVAVVGRVVKQIQSGIAKTLANAEENGVDKNELSSFITEREYEIKLYSEFLPKQMSEDKINSVINEVMSSISGTVNKGIIMKNLMPRVKGKADGRLVNELVEKALKK